MVHILLWGRTIQEIAPIFGYVSIYGYVPVYEYISIYGNVPIHGYVPMDGYDFLTLWVHIHRWIRTHLSHGLPDCLSNNQNSKCILLQHATTPRPTRSQSGMSSGRSSSRRIPVEGVWKQLSVSILSFFKSSTTQVISPSNHVRKSQPWPS